MKKGFTLIELLVVISIIGILAGLTLTGFTSARKNARDSERKSDLGQYRVALEAYSSVNSGLYPYDTCPAPDTCTGNSYDDDGIFVSAANSPIVAEYLPSQIEDPASSATYKYRYYQSADGLTYKLTAKLEMGGSWVVCSSGKAGKIATTPTADATCDPAL